MLIYGTKIVLRGVEEDDNTMLLSLINDPDTEYMLGGSSFPISTCEQLKWFEQQEQRKEVLRCIVAEKENLSKSVGTVILSEIDQKNGTGHINIKLSKDGARGKGYGTDAVRTLTNYAFNELRLNCIYANILSYNEASIGLFEKCGYERDGILRSRVYKSGKFVDLYAYSIVKSQRG